MKSKKAKVKAKFTFGSAEPAVKFECKLDKAKPKACTSPHTAKSASVSTSCGHGDRRGRQRRTDRDEVDQGQGQIDRGSADRRGDRRRPGEARRDVGVSPPRDGGGAGARARGLGLRRRGLRRGLACGVCRARRHGVAARAARRRRPGARGRPQGPDPRDRRDRRARRAQRRVDARGSRPGTPLEPGRRRLRRACGRHGDRGLEPRRARICRTRACVDGDGGRHPRRRRGRAA